MTRRLEHLVYEKQLTEWGLVSLKRLKVGIVVAFNYLPSGYRETRAGDTQSCWATDTNCSKGKTTGCLRKAVEYAFSEIFKTFLNKP